MAVTGVAAMAGGVLVPRKEKMTATEQRGKSGGRAEQAGHSPTLEHLLDPMASPAHCHHVVIRLPNWVCSWPHLPSIGLT